MELTINGVYADIYIKGLPDLVAKINQIDILIDGLMNAQIAAVLNSDKTEYFYDNSQTKIIVKYRDPEKLANAIIAFQKIKNGYINQINGRAVRMVDVKSINRYGWGC